MKQKRSTKKNAEAIIQLGIQKQWVECDFKVHGNRSDMENLILNETFKAANFLLCGLLKRDTIAKSNEKMDLLKTFDAVVHFVQAAGGTGVHVGDGFVLTCAHVVVHDDDEASKRKVNRIGRVKFLMFPSGRMFGAVCVYACESLDGREDVAMLRILGDVSWEKLPAARLADSPPVDGATLLCCGNPSNIDLETTSDPGRVETTSFHPSVWHCSIGTYKGVSHEEDLGDVKHSCWTYWGHSGAPLFDATGKVVALHSSWDDRNGMRHGVSLAQLRRAMRKTSAINSPAKNSEDDDQHE
eukprot:g2258.t1